MGAANGLRVVSGIWNVHAIHQQTFKQNHDITTGIGIPLLILDHSGNAAIIGVLGMLSGYCGTLMTPMAANFNVVPAALLELNNKHHVIMMQVIPGLVILAFNIFLMHNFAF